METTSIHSERASSRDISLPEVIRGPISRTALALYAGASHDHVPLHIDIDFARSAGRTDVFAHGMLSMAYLGQMLTHWMPQSSLVSWSVRFVAITELNVYVHCNGSVTELFEKENSQFARIEIEARTNEDVVTLKGEAVVKLSLDESNALRGGVS